MIAPCNRNAREFFRSVYVPSRIDLCAESIRQMEFSLTVMERWIGRPVTLDDCDEDFLRRFLTHYRRTHAAATTNSKRCQLLAIWRCAWEEGYVDQPPKAKRVRKARESRIIPEAWSAAEVSRILAAVDASNARPIEGIPARDWMRSIMLAMYDTGERKKATLSVTPQDVDLDAATILYRNTKTGDHRLCKLHPDTVAAIRVIYSTDRKRLWPWTKSREALDKRVKKILKASGVRYGRGSGGLLHKLRRTSGTLVEANGGDGAAHIGNTRKVFLKHYLDPRFLDRSQLSRLPRP